MYSQVKLPQTAAGVPLELLLHTAKALQRQNPFAQKMACKPFSWVWAGGPTKTHIPARHKSLGAGASHLARPKMSPFHPPLWGAHSHITRTGSMSRPWTPPSFGNLASHIFYCKVSGKHSGPWGRRATCNCS
jgi:hypothetical protein